MATEVIMPQMGEGITEGTIAKWLVDVGATVAKDQPLLEISTDKVDAEIPSPAAGVLLEVRYEVGSTVGVEDVLGLIGEPGESIESLQGGTPSQATPEAEAVLVSAAEPVRSGEPSPEPADSVDAEIEGEFQERIRKYSSPLVRRMAEEEGVDLSRLAGSGIHGRVTRADLEAYLEKKEEEQEMPPASPVETVPDGGAPVASRQPAQEIEFYVPPYTAGENVEIEPMSRIRQITAAHMAYSKATSAHVTSLFHMDMSRVARKRDAAKAGFAAEHKTKLTYMPFIFQVVSSALKANPKLNAAIDRTNVVFKKDIHLGMAVALDWGLVVPVVRHADRLSLVGLAKAANDLAERSRAKQLSPEELQGGTFTITNPGVFGSLFGTPIINQPQVAILGVGAVEKRPVVETDAEGNDTIAIKPMSYFAITFDHRLVDGSDADRFMVHIKKTLIEESWGELDPFI